MPSLPVPCLQLLTQWPWWDRDLPPQTVSAVLTTYTTLDADVDNSVSLATLFDSQLGRSQGQGRGRRRRQRRLRDDTMLNTTASDAAAPPDVDGGKCIGGAPDVDALNWRFNGATFFMLTVMTTIGYGEYGWV